jgi:signal transduction histidine kinase
VAAKVAHDVRNPLNAIEGGIHYLIGKYQNDSEVLNISNLIRGQVERLNSVTQDLLRVSKPMVPNFTECDLNRLVEESASFLEEEVRAAGQTLEKDYGTELPRVSLDFNQFQRVIINLVENAIEATPAAGTITLRTRNGEGGNGRWAFVQLGVLDTGRGIPGENLESITKPFYTTKVNGTGLGLSIVRQIVAQHQGELRILKREPGPGTEFLIRLPVKTALKDKTHA